MKKKSTLSPQQKDFPDEWKALFLGIEKDINISILVAKILIRIKALDESSKNILMRIFSDRIRKEIEDILSFEIVDSTKIPHLKARTIMRVFYDILGVNNIGGFWEYIKLIRQESQSTPPQSSESRD